MPKFKILLVDDDPQSLDSTRKILELSGYEVTTARDGQEALDLVRPAPDSEAASFDAVVSDVRMPRLGGIEFLRALSLCAEGTPVILMTAFGRVEDAVWAMKLGAVDFLTKPFKRHTLISSIESALKRARPARAESSGVDLLVGSSEPMRELRSVIAQVAPTSATVLLQGESGTGKELVASRIHAQSARPEGKFIALNCAAIPEHLIESELFGFEKGSFTGATSSRAGLFEAAHGGTLLLDEIGDMPLPLQAKLLRVLQEGEVRRLGSTESRRIDVRVIAATHQDLRAGVEKGSFRQDLLFRLEVIAIRVPTLRERGDADLQELAYHFLRMASRRHGKEINAISEEAISCLRAHSWPGNVRELSNVIERAVVFAQRDVVDVPELPPHIADKHKPAFSKPVISIPLGTSLKDVEELLIRRTLEATDGDKNMTARLLGINSRTIYRKLDRKEP